MLSLVHLQPNQDNKNSDDDDDDDDGNEEKEEEMPTTLQNHSSHPHPNHNLTMSKRFRRSDHAYFTSNAKWTCSVCNLKRKSLFNYHCSICKISMDIICANISQQKIDHPSHPHQLQHMPTKLVSHCNACGGDHQGNFYHYTTFSLFLIHLDCALLPAKLPIQQHTNATLTHSQSHSLSPAYSFPEVDKANKFYPRC
ncbi:unnamed protein product [Lactuca virosa]|uniref:DC1 domain-containing protein n=1 Tax=Lactuca virosa TaxID=75947 RepID=A0AAU9P780_9ASTR|nr:unnamed protein product [Lactuca virosa]